MAYAIIYRDPFLNDDLDRIRRFDRKIEALQFLSHLKEIGYSGELWTYLDEREE